MDPDQPSPLNDSDEAWAQSLEPKHTPPSGNKWLSGLALILGAIAFGSSAFLWYTLVYQRGLLRADVPATLQRIEQDNRELREAVTDTGGQLQSLSDTQDTLKAGMEKIQADLSRNRSEWVINEAEQLLMIANRRLQIARDLNTALTALQAADRQLELIANPSLLPVRRQISREIARIESIERIDVAGMTLRLASLAENISQLPLSPSVQPRPDAGTAAADADNQERGSWLARAWRDLLGLVRIRYYEAPEQPLLAPDQEYFARENLRLMLYGAQHALLQGNIPTFRQNVETAARWLGTYFDKEAHAVESAAQELSKLRDTQLVTELPDITTSLEMLRKATGRKHTP